MTLLTSNRGLGITLCIGILLLPSAVDAQQDAAARAAARKARRDRQQTAKAQAAVQAPAAAQKRSEARAVEAPLPGEQAFNECIKIPKIRRVKVTLKPDSDLSDLVGWISSMTCKRFIVASTLRAQKVTLVSPTPVTAGEAYHAFLSALEVLGLTVVPSGQYLKVVQGNWAIQSPIPTYGEHEQSRIPMSDAVVTQLVHIKHVDANELLLVLNKMKSRSGDVTTYRPTNTLIITDAGQNVRRMMKIVGELDIPTAGEKIWMMRLRHADAQEMTALISQIFMAQTGRGTQAQPARPPAPAPRATPGSTEDETDAVASKIIPDPASNSLIIVATAGSFAKIAALIRKLDIESEGGAERVHVYYLENAHADDMAATLSSLITGQPRGATGRQPQRQPQRPAAGGGTGAEFFEAEVRITADQSTNALVVVASARDYLNLRRVIQKLDIPRRQVFVEAVIMEVTLSKSRDLGVGYHGGGLVGPSDNQSLVFGSLGTQDINSFILNPMTLMGLAAGARGPLIDGSGDLLGLPQDIPAFGVMIQAMQNNGDINVLSAPHILTTDNVQAEILVGQNLPFQGAFVGQGLAGAAAAAGAGALLPTVSVQRQDVALKLRLTPHVNDSDFVRLEIEQEVSDIINANFNGLGPATSKRQTKTTVVARDQQTVVIGGLMHDVIRENVTKVPFLGDIPVLGYLFKSTSKSIEKTNLLIVLTPYVIRDQSDLRRIMLKKVDERREFITRYTSFQATDPGADIDYRHKRGLLGEIQRVGILAEQEAQLLAEARASTEVEESLPLDLPADLSPPGTFEGPSSDPVGSPPPAAPTSERPPSNPASVPPGPRYPPLPGGPPVQ